MGVAGLLKPLVIRKRMIKPLYICSKTREPINVRKDIVLKISKTDQVKMSVNLIMTETLDISLRG